MTFACPTVGADCRPLIETIPAEGIANFDQARDGNLIGSFLQAQGAPPGFLGDGLNAVPVTGGTVRNTIEVVDPAGNVSVNTNFVIIGKKFGMDVAPFPATPNLKALLNPVAPITTTITVTNVTGAPLAFGAVPITIAGADLTDFTVAAAGNTCAGATLTPTVATPFPSCSFDVAFAPLTTTPPKGPRQAKATIATTTTNVPAGNSVIPAGNANLVGTAQVPVTVTVGANGAVDKVVTPANVAAATENIDIGATVKYLTKPNDVVANVSKFRPLATVNGATVPLAADGTFELANIGVPQTVDVAFVRPGDVSDDGQVGLPDALESLRIVTGLNDVPTDKQRLAADVGPLVGGKPAADGRVDISDELAILWRVVQPTNPNW
jgi:hypothetical protein